MLFTGLIVVLLLLFNNKNSVMCLTLSTSRKVISVILRNVYHYRSQLAHAIKLWRLPGSLWPSGTQGIRGMKEHAWRTDL